MLGLGLKPHEKKDLLVALRESIDRMELEFSQLAAEVAKEDAWRDDGSYNALDWIRFNCHLTSNAAADRLAVGERAAELPESIQAMNQGEIGFAHLAVMTRTANALGDGFSEARLLEFARENSPGKFHFQCMHYRHAVDPKTYAQEQADLTESRRLFLSTAEDGCLLISGVLDPVGGATFRAALEPLARRLGKDDHRIRQQRYADAAVELAGSKQKVALQVTASVETLLGLVGAPGAENEFTLPISSKTVERWACDCSLTRILMQDSVVIDVGRAERTIKGPRRRALIARDRHCQWPGCERPASWCDGHHLKHWLHDGTGEIENQVMLCQRHHWLVHEGRWQLIKTDDGQIVTIPPYMRFDLPRGPD